MAIYKLKNRLGKKQVYNLLKFYFPLDECRWYTFDRIDKFLYRLSFGGFEYILSMVMGGARVRAYDTENHLYLAEHPVSMPELINFGVYIQIDNREDAYALNSFTRYLVFIKSLFKAYGDSCQPFEASIQ